MSKLHRTDESTHPLRLEGGITPELLPLDTDPVHRLAHAFLYRTKPEGGFEARLLCALEDCGYVLVDKHALDSLRASVEALGERPPYRCLHHRGHHCCAHPECHRVNDVVVGMPNTRYKEQTL